MDIQKNNMGVFSRKQRYIIMAIIIAVITCVITISMVLITEGNKLANEEVEEYLSELSYQTSYKVSQRVDTNLNTLSSLNDELNIVAASEVEKIIDNTLAHSAYEDIGYINTQGVFIMSNGKQVDVSQTGIMTSLREGKASVSNDLFKMNDGKEGVIYSVPSSYNDDYIALAGWIPTDTMVLLMHTDTFEGIGFSHIVATNGDYILKSDNENAYLNKGSNFFTELEKSGATKTESDVQKMKKNLLNDENGTIEYDIDGEKRSLTYVALNNADWYLLSIVPSNIYVHGLNKFTNNSILSIAIISVILFTALTFAIIFISTRKNRVISDIAYVDPITSGFTKNRFEIAIKEKMRAFAPFSYIMIDIRKFKLINDLKGSKGGDEVLRHVYRCIMKHLNEDEFAARMQADNFEIVFNTIDKDEISRRLTLISEEINKFNETRVTPYYLPIDCGIYVVDTIDNDLIIIRDRANSARKNNKENSQTHLCSCIYYNDLERLQMVQEKEIDNAMEKALIDEEFEIYLQPKINVNTNKVAGAEALIRWNSPTMGFLSPDKFIPYFEKTGFIVKLDLFVFEKVCKQLREWIDQGVKPIPISVNLSKRDLYDNDYLKRYKKIQKQYDIPSHLLEIEFTETLFFENLELLKRSIKEVHDAGYQCSIDDFGSGYSSLALLKEIEVDILKLDKTFFDNVSSERADKVVEHVIALAKDLNMLTIAEGVETVIQVERLRKMKCDLIQGYVYYKPITIEKFNKIVFSDYEIVEI